MVVALCVASKGCRSNYVGEAERFSHPASMALEYTSYKNAGSDRVASSAENSMSLNRVAPYETISVTISSTLHARGSRGSVC